jgi:hypothetical protein
MCIANQHIVFVNLCVYFVFFVVKNTFKTAPRKKKTVKFS